MACIAPDPGNPDHMTRATTYRLVPVSEHIEMTEVRAA
jgi:hypothetical protein